MHTHYDFIVIGGGSGGIAAAKRAAAHGAETLLVEAGRIGGTCVNRGCVPKKVLWNASRIAETIRLAHQYGFAGCREARFDWRAAKAARDAYLARLNEIYHRSLAEAGVKELAGFARFKDARTVLVDGAECRAEHILIATGSRPSVPEVPGAELGITSDAFFELEEQPQRIAVVGGGYIAVEIAGVLNALGAEVTMLLRGETLLRGFDCALRETLMDAMQAAGIDIVSAMPLERVTRDERGRLELHGPEGRRIGGFDTVLWATGRKPCTEGLELARAGVICDARGFITTDAYQNTNIAGIYAVGDVTGRKALTPVAIGAGRRLADRLFGSQPDARLDYDDIPTVVFSHPPIGTVGMTEEEARGRYGHGAVKVYQSRFTNMLYAVTEHKAPTVVKLVTVGEDERILGCHVIGDDADEIIQGFAVAVKMGARKRDLERTVPIHPTAAEELITLR